MEDVQKEEPVTGKMMYLVRTPDVGLNDPSMSWDAGGGELIALSDAEAVLYLPEEAALA